eukprot:CAMPEP_0183734168 /NCGR_PEP_ID=MMETSP0737-20130205/43083_1 /TAXON_ID=385413 /ORGANISM="Thalassiosira miniscula, Strain CCMP1093" /LENGTH=138 /DNA_ID=CAMNT_0025967591 /DNA_START=122 /DNA_END=538 /DNA_ORIENTATION=+
MKATTLILAITGSFSLDAVSSFCASSVGVKTSSNTYRCSELFAGGWGNNQERSVFDEEVGGVNGAPIYDSYEIEDRGKFMQRVNAERKSLRIKKAADLLEVARIAGVELKKKERDPEKLDMFDPEDLSSDEDYLDVSI